MFQRLMVVTVAVLALLAGPAVASGPILVTGAGEGGGPHVRVFDAATGVELFSFFAFNPAFTGGVRVATADVDGDGVPDLIVAAGPGGGPHVRIFDGAALLQGQLVEKYGFMAYDVNFHGGVFIAAAAPPPGAGRIGTNTNNAGAGDGATCTLGQSLLTASPSVTAGGVPANGQLLSISQNTAMFSLLGTTYGGNGTTTFALPDLRGLAPNNMTYSICDRGFFPARR